MAAIPTRIQLKREKGWRKPAGAVVVSRPTCWGNPYAVAEHTAAAHHASVDAYRQDLLAGRLPYGVDDVRRALAGRDLCCWCPAGLPCHADVLLDLANRDGG